MTYSDLVIDGKYQVKTLGETTDGTEIIGVNAESLVEVVCFLQKGRGTSFDILLSVFGTDKPEYFEVTYHLFSTKHNKSVLLKVFLDRKKPQIESLSSIYPAANWHERETYDLLGIKFLNHPNLERILLPNDWKGHPLRKDYVNDDERLIWNER